MRGTKWFVGAVAVVAAAEAFAADPSGSGVMSVCPTDPNDPLGALCRSMSDIFDKVPAPTTQCDPKLARPYPSHATSPFYVDGDWTFDAARIKEKYRNLDPAKFGSTDIQLPTGGVTNVRDMHYNLGEDGMIGMRPIPVSDDKPDGSKEMDAFLRSKMGLKSTDPIFALIAYQHPEEHTGTLKQLGSEMVKTEGGETHLGAYIGNGRTRNSPETYHNNKWEVSGYPATVQMVSLEGVKQATLNGSFETASAILNQGVQFPGDYKNDTYRTIDLKTTLEFYKGWLTDDPKLRNDPTWFTYCAEHQTIVTNIGLNVPPNRKAYQDIWGQTEGSKLFDLAKTKYKAATGKALVERSFTPLWKKDGIADPTNETGVGKGLAWAPESTADLVVNFMETYASFPDVGGTASAAALLGFKDVIKERMGVADEQYLKIATPVINKMLIAEAMTQPAGTDWAAWIQKKTAELYVGFGGKPDDFAPGGTINPQLMALAKSMTVGLTGHAAEIAQNAGMCKDNAWSWFRSSIEPELAVARTTPVGEGKVSWYSPPAVTHRVASGMIPHDPNVSIVEIATAMDSEELVKKSPVATNP